MQSTESVDSQLRHVKIVFPKLPVHTIHVTSCLNKMFPSYEDSIFVYVVYPLKDVTFYPISMQSKFFHTFSVNVEGFSESAGYVFVPKIQVPWKIRYTPYAISVTMPAITASLVEASEIETVYRNQYFEVTHLSCGCEFIHTIGHLMSVDVTTLSTS